MAELCQAGTNQVLNNKAVNHVESFTLCAYVSKQKLSHLLTTFHLWTLRPRDLYSSFTFPSLGVFSSSGPFKPMQKTKLSPFHPSRRGNYTRPWRDSLILLFLPLFQLQALGEIASAPSSITSGRFECFLCSIDSPKSPILSSLAGYLT